MENYDLESTQEDLKEFISKGNTLICWVADISDTFEKDCDAQVLYITSDGLYKTVGTYWNYALPLTESELINEGWCTGTSKCIEKMLDSLRKFNDFIGSKNMKHKHYDLIEEWARTGKIAQYWCMSRNKWVYDPYPVWIEELEYRLVPDFAKSSVIKYKRYIFVNILDEKRIGIHHAGDGNNPEEGKSFSEWIDTIWKEVKV